MSPVLLLWFGGMFRVRMIVWSGPRGRPSERYLRATIDRTRDTTYTIARACGTPAAAAASARVMCVLSGQVLSGVGDECSIRQPKRFVRVQMEHVRRFLSCTQRCETRPAVRVAALRAWMRLYTTQVRRARRVCLLAEKEEEGWMRKVDPSAASSGAQDLGSCIRC